MYTSGTTGEPKGIMFSQDEHCLQKILRAMAIPEIGDEDRFICFSSRFIIHSADTLK